MNRSVASAFRHLTAILAAVMILAPTVRAQDRTPDVPFLQQWLASPHAEADSESFNHWNKEGVVPVPCATCHSGPGFVDFLGGDGSTPKKVDKPAPIKSVIDCVTCHNPAAIRLQAVMFPSGTRVANLGPSARCMVCHQGRESTVSVTKALAGMGDDAVSPKLTFINVHYRAAAATLMGTTVKGGYEYDGRNYHGRFAHTPTMATCVQCHDPHRTSVRVEACGTCHRGQALTAIRMRRIDYDGDGNAGEGVAGEIVTLHQALGRAITAYAKSIAGTPIVYDSHAYPYFFTDKNGNGTVDKGEAIFPNAYKSWTPRLLRAAYNYQYIAKDPGAYAHNPPYALQLLYDSLESLSAKVSVDMAPLKRP